MLHRKELQQEWKEEGLSAFDELMVSWNARRPKGGKYSIYVSVKEKEWSPWLLYATWGKDEQSSHSCGSKEAPIRVYQDAVTLNGVVATGFKVKAVAEGGADLKDIYGVHVYTNGKKKEEPISYSSPIYLQIPGLSQMALQHPRSDSLCSPTATTAVVRYLLNHSGIDPIGFAKRSWDCHFDIYGNWVLNIAEASTYLGPNWQGWVERLSGFGDIYRQLQRGIPVVVSVRGPLVRSAQPYAKGHLMAVIGYDPEKQEVICMDPAFDSDEKTHVRYPLPNFVEAWERRGKIAYLFRKEEG